MENHEDPRWELTADRKAAMLAAADELKKILDRNPPPTYIEVSEAIDKIAHENDRA